MAGAINTERALTQPTNEYGLTKLKAENIFRTWQKSTNNSLIIIRPTVVFGEDNRGNVYNLFKQIASRKFIMIGSGKNVKSMAYIGNLVSFLAQCINSDEEYGLYNYVDTPDMTMGALVEHVNKTLNGDRKKGLVLPLWLGLMAGRIADLLAFLSRKKLPISYIRVIKFSAPSEFSTSEEKVLGFTKPYKLIDGINSTLNHEFISPNESDEFFHTR